MSKPQPKLSEYTEFQPKKERRIPLPITNLPVNAISEEIDPTLEIRTLIEQLQQTARDARTQTRSAEQERDTLTRELAHAEQQLESLRESEAELRSHFVEVTSLIAERDTALDECERRGHALSEAARKLDNTARERNDAQRQREEAIRLRDETLRKLESYTRASDEQSRLIAETQKQILAIRQARDTAHAQILDLTNKISRAEDAIANLEYERDTAEQVAKLTTTEAAEYRRQLEATALDRDATAKQVEELTHELDEQRKKLLDLAEQKSAVLQSDNEHASALAEARGQVLSVSHERDAARARAQEQAKELEELRQQFQSFREEEAGRASVTIAETREKLTALEAQARDARHGSKNLQQELDAVNEQLTTLQQLASQSTERQAGLEQQLAALSTERDAALSSLTSAQTQIDEIIRDRETVREQAVEQTLTLEGQIAALRAQIQTLETTTADAQAAQDDLRVLQRRFDKQRVETIDLATQLQSAQREVRELSANLAEARLQVKFATAASRAAKSGATKSDFAALVTETAPEPAPAPELSALGIEETLSEKEAKSALGAMRHCLQSFTKTPSDLSLLNELHCHVHSFSERARTTGYLAVHRLCAALSELTRGLYDIPEQVNPATLRTVTQATEFLGTLMRDKNFAQAKDPAKALIYAVDDDVGNCDAVKLSMETAGMRTHCAQEPSVALAELAGSRYDLIILDVNLPGMDGFELCKHIRDLAIHATTPVLFLTGVSTLDNRVQSSLSGGSDFIGKPFNLHELSVKAMMLILKTQLQLA